MIRSLAIDVGFRVRDVLSAEVTLDPHDYPREASARVLGDLLDRVGQMSGVERAALASAVPGGRVGAGTGVEGATGTITMVNAAVISENYFSALSIPIVAGRAFTAEDAFRAPLAVIVNESFVRTLARPPAEVLGTTMGMGSASFRIVGVAADARDDQFAQSARPKVYVSYRQMPQSTRMTLLVRAKPGALRSLPRPLARLVASVAPDVPLFNVRPLDEVIAAKFARQRLVAVAVSVFAGLTLLLAAVGVHGIMAFTLASRKREIGVRRALGGDERAVLGLMVWRGMRLVICGIGIGIPTAWVIGWVLEAAFVDMKSEDPAAYVLGAALVALTGLAASTIPARRAMKDDPISVLRSQ